jgi:hypothetical protein
MLTFNRTLLATLVQVLPEENQLTLLDNFDKANSRPSVDSLVNLGKLLKANNLGKYKIKAANSQVNVEVSLV